MISHDLCHEPETTNRKTCIFPTGHALPVDMVCFSFRAATIYALHYPLEWRPQLTMTH